MRWTRRTPFSRRSGCRRTAIASRMSLPTAGSACSRSHSRSRLGRACCCSTSPLRACQGTKAPTSLTRSPPCPRTSRCFSSSTTWTWCSASRAASSSWLVAESSSKEVLRKSCNTQRCAASISARRAMAEPLLELRNVRAGYGDAVVLDDVSLDVPERSGLAVLGRNGVGKTTLLLTVMGYTRLMRGAILWRGRDITRLPPHLRARLGVGWVAQEREIFPSLSVEENLTVAARPGRWELPGVYALFPGLAERGGARGNQLSGGEQQMLAIARALMTNPALLLLDEPFEGLAPIIIEELTEAIRRMVDEQGTAAVLVEQHTEIALSLTEEAVVIERGRIAHRAKSRDLPHDAETLERLLGLRVSA